MNWKTWTPLAVAVVLGIVAAKMTRDMIAKNRNNGATAQKLATVVVAKSDIAPGTELTAEHLALSQISQEAASDRMFKEVSALVGRVTEMDMVKGQTILAPMLAEAGSGSGLQALVPMGMRAITMEVNEFSGVAGMLTPGCRVDVVATLRESGTEQAVARTIVENVKVSAVGARVSGTSEEQAQQEVSKSVTLLTTPEQAEAIELAAATARPRLVLRGGRDNQPSNTMGITVAQLVGTGVESQTNTASLPADPFVSEAPSTQPAPVPTVTVQTRKDPFSMPNRRSVQIIRNGVESTVSIDLRRVVAQTIDLAQTTDDQTGGEVTEIGLEEIDH